uniref:Pc21g00130 putative n=1 Tax=Albugo laibachii Nc14 TaxID=890382 RepID=F0WQI4_9STRA|nr:Pc21g00130 putative [Albugo laibachii Nc14]|eukprot:CCA23593.1 Pc21g00130 putative [Albugo laibachii Nc14]
MESDEFLNVAYSSANELFTALQIKAHVLNFSLSTLRSDCKKRKMIVVCNRAGSYNSIAVERKSKTKSTGCEYRLITRQIGVDKLWKEIRREGAHNHDMFKYLTMHPHARRLTFKQQIQCVRLQRAGVRPKEKISFLLQDYPDMCSVSRDIYNEQRGRKEYLNGRMPIHALFDELQAKNYRFGMRRDAKGQICSLKFANPESVALAVELCDVVLLNCTYKTNKFKREEGKNYVWALNALKSVLERRRNAKNPRVLVSDDDSALLNAEKRVFPNATRLLFRWHINKNVLAKCKVQFTDGDEWKEMIADWSALCYAPSVHVFEAQWEEFQNNYQHHTAITQYLDTTSFKHKEKFVEAWVGAVFYLGCSTTSRAK